MQVLRFRYGLEHSNMHQSYLFSVFHTFYGGILV
jgi:hypothetical protein